MRKVSTLPGLVAVFGFLIALFLVGANSAEAVTCPSGAAQLSSGGSIGASQGGTASVNFTVAAGCNVQLSLVSYKAPSAGFDASTASQQVLFDSSTATLAAGAHTLSVSVPNCFFQVDFVFGAPLATLGPAGSNNFYSSQGRLISAANGGSTSCAVTTGGTTGGTGSTGNQTPVTVTTPTVTTTTTTVIPAGPITWAPGFGPNGAVASVQTAPTTTATNTNTGAVLGTQTAPVAVANLPSTSTDGDNNIRLVGIAAVALGLVLLRVGRPGQARSRLD